MLGHFNINNFFLYVTKTQAYKWKTEKFFVSEEKKFGRINSWGWFHQHFTWILYAHRFQKRKTDLWLDSIFALLGSVCVKSMHKMLVTSTPDWLLLIHCSVQSQNTREKCSNIEHNLCQCFLYLGSADSLLGSLKML